MSRDATSRVAERLSAYIAMLELVESSRAPGKKLYPLARRLGRRVVPEHSRIAARIAGTMALLPRERRRGRRIASRRPLRLHYGSAAVLKPDWVNIDLAWDLRRPLPFADGSVAAIFHEHLLEHLSRADGLALTQECHRLQGPGGTLRIGVPDGKAYVRSYVEGTEGFLARIAPGRPTAMLAMAEVFLNPQHRTMYDLETLAVFLEASGFDASERCAAGRSRNVPCPDTEGRREETLSVEVVWSGRQVAC